MANNVMVFVEQSEGKLATVSLELICEGKRLAQKLGVEVEAVALGNQMKEKLKELGWYGCKSVYYLDDKRLAHFTSIPYAKNIVQVIQKYKPQIVLFGATIIGRDIAPRVSSELGCGLTADCTELDIGDYESKGKSYKNILLQNRPAFGGNIIATIVSPESTPSMATVRPGVIKMSAMNSACKIEIIEEKVSMTDKDMLTEVIEVIRTEKAVNLNAANIIVSAGMGAANSLELIKTLAQTLGGQVACSRPVVDSGILVRDHQVGQTGVTVRPNLYIACGISGQIQHRAGMSEAKRIIAINNDPQAPIFSIAHYGIVGDLNEVLPRMIKAYKGQ